MTFGAGWALAGLVLLVPLVILHLRPRTRTPRELPSLLLWRDLESDATTVSRRPRLPPLPLLLLLQALALIALVLALAEPSSGSSRRPAATVIVLDNSFWMQAPGRLAAERRAAERIIVAAPGAVRIVEANATPAVVYRGPAAGATQILRGLRAGASAPDLSGAITVAAGLLTNSRDRLAVIRAPEDPLPTLRAGASEVRTAVAGSRDLRSGDLRPLGTLWGRLADELRDRRHGHQQRRPPGRRPHRRRRSRATRRWRSPRASAPVPVPRSSCWRLPVSTSNCSCRGPIRCRSTIAPGSRSRRRAGSRGRRPSPSSAIAPPPCRSRRRWPPYPV